MILKDLIGKKICFLGLGIENHALLLFLLQKKIKAEFFVCDARSDVETHGNASLLQNKNIVWRLGKHYDQHLDRYDIIFRIAGYPLFSKNIIKAMMAGVEISSPTKLFFDICPTKNIIGVTGSKGKGTTASLIYQILKDAGKRAHFGGNIGIALFSFFKKIKPDDWVVLELSSFQLEDLHVSPHIAVITNFFPEHLAAADPLNPNYHKTLATYWEAKTNIFSHQSKHDFLVVSEELKEKLHHEKVFSRVRYFGSSKLATPLVGSHNRRNVAAAQTVARIAGISARQTKKSVAAFKGLEHRLELAVVRDNRRYYNDSFATTPEAALTALHSFEPGRIIIIAGGSSKASDFRALAGEIKKYARMVFLLPGKGSRELKAALTAVRYRQMRLARTMQNAVAAAEKMSQPGDVILLAPACASFGIFKNYKDRGEQFKKAVLA
jgi:UDP-N-acetylmuramoylalanine--D-glutamate ligase